MCESKTLKARRFWQVLDCKYFFYSIKTISILLIFGIIFGLTYQLSNIAKAEITYSELNGEISLESRYFFKDPINNIQQNKNLSLVAKPEVYLENNSGTSLTITPFFRFDESDSHRTHWDLREAYAMLYGDLESSQWEIRIGFDKVFWGVTESFHLIDIINQSDVVEDPSLEEKLGQPMIHGTWVSNLGNFEAFLLPYFRERTFLGQRSRLRNNLVVDSQQTNYESASGRNHLDLAMRYSNTFELFDIGLSMFDGTNRSPTLSFGLDRGGSLVLIPTYAQIRQYSTDTQVTLESWLLKFEGYWRNGEKNRELIEQDYAAFISGFEYTQYAPFNSKAELAFIGEFLWDSRGKNSLSAFENDFFSALRIAINDVNSTEILIGYMQDLDESSRSFAFELGRRINDQWFIEFNSTLFSNLVSRDLQFPLRRDNFAELTLNYSF